MNKIKHTLIFIIPTLLSALFSFNKDAFITKSVETKATISELAGPGDYYDSIDDSLTGDDLKNALANLNSSIRKSTVGYDGLRTLYQIIDRDWTGKEDDGKVVGFYNNALLGPKWDSGSTWNREHVWPNSRGGGSGGGSSTSPKVDQDAHMPRPTSTKINSSRGNDAYAESGAYDPASEGIENYRGIAARIIFYCAIADTNLTIVDSTNFGDTSMGKLSDLLKWNLQYLPSTSADAALELRVEQNRNETIQTQTVQKNRNPFIDHPEYACKIWGNTNSSTKQICASSYDEIIPTKIELNKTELTLKVDENETLTVSTLPTNATKSFTWSSSNSNVATVSSSGLVKALSEGSATITVASTLDPSIKATCSVTVSKSETIVNSIKNCYSIASGTTVSNIYGIYVGTSDGKSPIIMNGEYGITLYGGSLDSSWVKNQTVLKASGTLDIYNNLYEIKSYSASVITNEEEIANNVSPVVTYTVNGSETSSDTSLASRLCLVSGTVESTSDLTSDYKATIKLSNSKTVNLFVKSTYKDSLKDVIVEGATLTLKGFTSIHYSTFQISVFENVTIDESYTANDFATELMNKTDSICASSTNKASDLSPVWIDLEQNCYSKLSESEKNVLLNSGATYKTGTTIEQAMDRYDYIVSHYKLNNFINRNITKSDIRINFLMTNDSQLLLILSLTGISFVAITVGLILIKRKVNKE